MLVGTAGSGKTVLMQDKLNSLPEDDWLIANVPFNFYTTSQMLQGQGHSVKVIILRSVNFQYIFSAHE